MRKAQHLGLIVSFFAEIITLCSEPRLGAGDGRSLTRRSGVAPEVGRFDSGYGMVVIMRFHGRP